MLSSRVPGIFLIVATVAFGAFPARADVFPWVPKVQLNVLEDPYVDMALRVELIRRAKSTIRIATYQQMTDKRVGLPILKALREAAMRGVRVQFVTGRWPAMIFDRDDLIPKMLTDVNLTWPAKVIEFGGVSNRAKGWNVSDSMHEKIFLIDDELAIAGGRNLGDQYLEWLDFAVLIRNPALIKQVRKAFDALWFDMASFSEPLDPITVRPGDLPDPLTDRDVPLQPAQKTELAGLLAWLDRKAAAPAVSTFVLDRTRVITHRFFRLLSAGAYNGEARLSLPDDIVGEICKLVPGSREIRLSTLFVLLNPKLRDSLVRALRDGTAAYFFFNGDSSSRETVPLALSYKDSLEDLLTLMRASKADGTPAKTRVAVLRQNDYRFLHKKMFIVDNHVFFGSHNFNLPSTVANSEISIEVDDARFAAAMSLRYDHDFLFSGEPLTLKQAAEDFENTSVTRWFAKFVHGFF